MAFNTRLDANYLLVKVNSNATYWLHPQGIDHNLGNKMPVNVVLFCIIHVLKETVVNKEFVRDEEKGKMSCSVEAYDSTSYICL